MSPSRFSAWSRRRQLISVATLLLVLTGAGLFTSRATLAPLELWVHAKQCAGSPDGNVNSLFGLANSSELRGTTRITILDIDTISASGAHPPRYWIVPVTNGSGGTGSASTADPPQHWNERAPAVGATISADRPANLLVELQPDHGHALLGEISVTYRTPDGFIHTATGDAGMEVDTTARCSNTTGPFTN